MLHTKNIMTKWLLSRSIKVTSVCTEDVDCSDNAQQIFWCENDKCLLFTIGWSGQLLFFVLCSSAYLGKIRQGLHLNSRPASLPQIRHFFLKFITFSTNLWVFLKTHRSWPQSCQWRMAWFAILFPACLGSY